MHASCQCLLPEVRGMRVVRAPDKGGAERRRLPGQRLQIQLADHGHQRDDEPCAIDFRDEGFEHALRRYAEGGGRFYRGGWSSVGVDLQDPERDARGPDCANGWRHRSAAGQPRNDEPRFITDRNLSSTKPFPGPAVARRPERTAGAFLTHRIVASLLVGTSDDAVVHGHAAHAVLTDKLQYRRVDLGVGAHIAGLREPALHLRDPALLRGRMPTATLVARRLSGP